MFLNGAAQVNAQKHELGQEQTAGHTDAQRGGSDITREVIGGLNREINESWLKPKQTRRDTKSRTQERVDYQNKTGNG